MLYRLYYLIIAGVWLIRMYGKAFLQRNRGLRKLLSLPENQQMSEQEWRRFGHYFYGTTYLAAFMCCLRGSARTRKEAQIFINLTALASIFDDLADTLSKEKLEHSQRQSPEFFGQAADTRGLARGLLAEVLRELPANNLAQFRKYVQQVFDAELRVPTEADLSKTSAEKGGYSVLLFRRVLAHPLSPEEEAAQLAFGSLIQLADDIFDLWHDEHRSQTTLATAYAARGDCAGLGAIFEQQLRETQRALRRTPYPSAQVETTLAVLHFLASTTRVCLRHYLTIEKKYGGHLPLHDRTKIVVDMEKWPNRLRVAGELLRFVR